MILTLPYPPTANNLFLNVEKGRVKSLAYRTWIAAGLWHLSSQKPQRIAGPYRLTITAVRPDNRARDLDNVCKPISDLLKRAGVVEDDSKAASIYMAWSVSPPVKGGEIRVSVEPAEPEAVAA